MTWRASRLAFPLILAVGLAACADPPRTETRQRVRRLADPDKNGIMTEMDHPDDECAMWPDPGECPYLEWTETWTTVVDEHGNVIDERYEFCSQCLDEDLNPIGEPECFEDPPLPPEVWCEEYTGPDGWLCFYCIDESMEVVYEECVPPPDGCTSDADCPDGYECWIDPGFPPEPPTPGDPSDPMGGDDGMSDPGWGGGGTCVPRPDGECMSDEDCPDGHVCVFWEEPPPPWDPGTPDDPTDPIDPGSDPGWGGGWCEPIPDYECTCDTDCPDGAVCEFVDPWGGYCVPPPPPPCDGEPTDPDEPPHPGDPMTP